jgi:hypothetical protein
VLRWLLFYIYNNISDLIHIQLFLIVLVQSFNSHIATDKEVHKHNLMEPKDICYVWSFLLMVSVWISLLGETVGVSTCKDAFVVSEHKRLNIVQVHGSSVFYPTLFCSLLLYCGFKCYMMIWVSSPVTVYCKTCLLEQQNLLNVWESHTVSFVIVCSILWHPLFCNSSGN